jgi:glycosyltransferase involved in cell wall biosynthesis
VRVALLSDRFPPQAGGLAAATARIARGLAEAGDEVEAFALHDDGLPGEVRIERGPAGLQVLRLSASRRPQDSAAELFELIARRHAARPFDLVHGFYLVRSGFLAAYAGGFLGLPSVVSARGNDLDRSVFDGEAGAHVLRALELATCVTGVSQELVRKARGLCPRARVLCVPNGVDSRVFRPTRADEALRRALGLAGRQVLGFSGEARVKKGLVPLLEATALLAGDRPISLLLAGGVRKDDAGLLAVFRKRQPAVHVVELEQRPAAQLAAVYALMDVFVHPSLRDGLPNALLEAMACGRPVVAARAGGIPDVVRDGRDGLLVEPGDARGLQAACSAVLDDPARAAAFGRAGRARVRRAFTPEAEIRSYRELYRELRADARRASGGALALVSR